MAYVYIRMGNSPRPGLWILEKSSDYGKTFVPWQYFSDSESDCITHFGTQSLQPITRDDSVVCTTEYSKIVPLTGGEVILICCAYVIKNGLFLDPHFFVEQQTFIQSLL